MLPITKTVQTPPMKTKKLRETVYFNQVLRLHRRFSKGREGADEGGWGAEEKKQKKILQLKEAEEG